MKANFVKEGRRNRIKIKSMTLEIAYFFSKNNCLAENWVLTPIDESQLKKKF